MNINKSKIPNFFIVGAAKSGTSSLWQYMKEHPQIFMPKDELYKEPRYFNNPKRFRNIEDYFRLFEATNENQNRVGEASTAYLTCPDCASKIADYGREYDLDIKIIILLRNPASRAYSLYNWMVQDGYEYSSTFAKALKREERRKKGTSNFWEPNYFYNYLYFNSGKYYEQVNQYIAQFGNENVYVETFENFIKNSTVILREIFTFLGVDPDFNVDVSKSFNPSVDVIHPSLQFSLRKLTKYLTRARIIKFNDKKGRDKLMKWGMSKKKVKKIDPEVKSNLLKRYKEDIDQLEALINKDLSIWKEQEG
ncbi:sulfotransferase domain-containing protein [Fulvivirgaceae bacterium BMA10]|uniref:Sulfotransferase domain-containing protein n=1 Tax=Splendidivirga corallicola TaxID=3051826 RepID=A0ABT8L0S2_9BACT|nr:sulfotransferase domain-containing protein [Fulvivirgaceae bacterium BMA10]